MAQAFNWDQYQDAQPALAARPVQAQAGPQAQGQSFNWDQFQDASPPPSAHGVAQTALEHFANGLTLGYLPQIQAATDPIAYKIGDWLTGENLQPEPYVTARDRNIARLAQEAQANPKTAVGSELAGAGTGALLTPIGEAGGVTEGLLKGAAVGGGYGALSNPGDVQGVVDPLQLHDRAINAGKGALIGGVTGGVTQGVSKVLSKAAGAPESLESAAEGQAVKASGAMLKDFRSLNGRDQLRAVGRFALDNGIVRAGDTVRDVADKAEAVQQQAGSQLETIYNQAKEAIPGANEEMSSKWQDMSPQEFEQAKNIGFSPVRDKDQILSQIKSSLGNTVGKKAALDKVSGYLDQLAEDHGDEILDPKSANDIEGSISDQIKWSRNPQVNEPATESAFRALRKIVSDKVDDQVEFLGKQSGNPELGQKLAEANRNYGMAKTIATMAKDKINRIMTNNHFSLTDRIAGGSGAVAGGLVGGMMGNDWRGEAEGALVGGVGGAILNHLGGEYGNAILARSLQGASNLAEMGPAQIARAGSVIANPATANLATRVASAYGTNTGQIAPNPNAPMPQPMQPEPNGPVIPKASSGQDMNAANPQKGPTKWAQDGFQKLRVYVSPKDQATLEKYQAALMSDPKAKQMLIAASSFPPGSKGLDKIMSQIRSRYGSGK